MSKKRTRQSGEKRAKAKRLKKLNAKPIVDWNYVKQERERFEVRTSFMTGEHP
jgi:hypothetical protein